MKTDTEMEFEKKELTKDRIVSFVVGSQIIIALIFLTFGFYQKSLRSKGEEAFAQQRQENTVKLNLASKELEACRQNK